MNASGLLLLSEFLLESQLWDIIAVILSEKLPGSAIDEFVELQQAFIWGILKEGELGLGFCVF